MPNYQYVTEADLFKVEGEFPHAKIRDALEKISPVQPAWAFREYVMETLGFSEATSYAIQASIYNKIADSLNKLRKDVTADSLCSDLGIESYPIDQT